MEVSWEGVVRWGVVETDKKIENRVPKPENFIRWKNNIPIKKGSVVSKNGRYYIFVVIYTIDIVACI